MNSERPLQRSAVTTPRPYQGRGVRLIARVNGPEAFSPHLGENLPPLLLGIVTAIAQLVSLPKSPSGSPAIEARFEPESHHQKKWPRFTPPTLFHSFATTDATEAQPQFLPSAGGLSAETMIQFLVSKLIDLMKAAMATHQANRAIAIRRLSTRHCGNPLKIWSKITAKIIVLIQPLESSSPQKIATPSWLSIGEKRFHGFNQLKQRNTSLNQITN